MSSSAEDIFDIVNERDEVIDRKPRSEVHASGLLHRAVHVLVFNSQGEIFLQKRSMKKDRQPGVWDSSCSGHVDSGEDYDQTAVRELGEEIGLKLSVPPQRLFKINACPKPTPNLSGSIAAKTTAPSNCNPTKSKKAIGSHPTTSHSGSKKNHKNSPRRLSTSGTSF